MNKENALGVTEMIKKVVCIGDSLTEGDYGVFGKSGIANVQEKNYPYYLGKLLGTEVVNCGKCGFTATSYLEYYKSGAVCADGADLVIVMLGTNGGLDGEKDVPGNRDYDSLIKLIKVDADGARIVLCTPPHTTVNPDMSNCGYAPQAEKAARYVRRYAEENKLDCIEVAECGMFSDENEPVMQPNDGLHFSEVGYGVMAVYIKDELKRLKIVG